YNPAGIAESDGTNIFIDANVALRHATYSHDQAQGNPAQTGDQNEPADAKGANYGEGTLFNVIAVPMIGASTKIGDLALGAAFYIPTGGSSMWSQNDAFKGNRKYPGPVDGIARWYSMQGEILSYYWTLAVAYEFKQIGLSIGASGNLIHSSINTIRASTSSSDNDVTNEGRSFLDVGGWQGSFGVGADLEVIRKTLWFGASYQARPNVAGGMTLKGHLKENLAGVVTDDEVELHQDLPDVIRIGGRFRPVEDWEIRLFGDWTRWSAFKNQCIVQAGGPCNVN